MSDCSDTVRQEESRAAQENLRNRFAEFIPRVEDVLGLVCSDGLPSVPEFLEVFYAPIAVISDSGAPPSALAAALSLQKSETVVASC